MTQHTFDFTGQTVIVTGGATGIGRATALAFGRAGANVVIASIGDGDGSRPKGSQRRSTPSSTIAEKAPQ